MPIVNKIKLPNNTTVDINDARDVVVGNGVNNVVTLTNSQYQALSTKDANTIYVITDVTPSGGGGGGGSGSGEENVIEAITFNGSAVPVTNKTAAITASIPDPVMTTEFVGSMNRTDVSGSGNLTVKNTSGTFPTVPAGTYVVKTISSSSTSNYTISVSFGGQTYSLSTSNGLINDSRTLTFSSNATWSGSITTVNSSTTLIVKVYSTDAVATTVGLAAVSNDYDDLDNKPTIPSAVTETTVTNWGFTKNAGTVTGVKVNGSTQSPSSGVVDIGTVLTSFTESDPIFSASAASGITSSDITNWNSKTSNVGTLTAVTFNGASATVTGSTAAITATIPTVPTISTSVSDDANSDVKTSSPKSVKTYVDGIVGNIESLLAAI